MSHRLFTAFRFWRSLKKLCGIIPGRIVIHLESERLDWSMMHRARPFTSQHEMVRLELEADDRVGLRLHARRSIDLDGDAAQTYLPSSS
jgi:hypothetical protein